MFPKHRNWLHCHTLSALPYRRICQGALVTVLLAALLPSAPIRAEEASAGKPAEIVLLDGAWSGTPLAEYLASTLDYADNVTKKTDGRKVRPSDRLFGTAVMRHLGSLSLRRDERLLRLLELLNDEDSRVRYVGLSLIHRDWNMPNRLPAAFLKKQAAYEPLLVKLLRDELWETAQAAAQQLAAINASQWPPELTDFAKAELLSDDVAAQRRVASLLRAGFGAPTAVEPALLSAWQRLPAGEAKNELAWALFHYGKIPTEAVPLFITAVRATAAKSAADRAPRSGGMCCAPSRAPGNLPAEKMVSELGNIQPRLGRDSVAVIPALVELLDDRDIEVRRAAVNMLGAMGPLAKAALPKLRTMSTRHTEVRVLPQRVVFGQSTGGVTEFVTSIEAEAAAAHLRIAGQPLQVTAGSNFTTYHAYLNYWLSSFHRLDIPSSGFYDFIRQQPEAKHLQVTIAIFAAIFAPR